MNLAMTLTVEEGFLQIFGRKSIIIVNPSKKNVLTKTIYTTNICTISIKTTDTWHHDYYGYQGYKKNNV